MRVFFLLQTEKSVKFVAPLRSVFPALFNFTSCFREEGRLRPAVPDLDFPFVCTPL